MNGQESAQISHEVDSLYKNIQAFQGDERLNAYRPLMNYMFTYQDSLFWSTIFDEFISDSRKYKNIEKEGFARELRLQYLSVQENSERFKKEYPKTMDFLYKNQLWYRYFYLCKLYVDILIAENRGEEAMSQLKGMYATADKLNNALGMGLAAYSMGLIAHMNFHPEEAEKLVKESIKKLTEAKSWADLPEAYKLLIPILMKEEKYKEALKFFDDWRNLIIEKEKQFGSNKNEWINYDQLLAKFYIRTKDLGNAEKLVKEMEEDEPIMPPAQYLISLQIKFQLLEAQEKYEEAIEMANKLYEIDVKDNRSGTALYYLDSKADLLFKSGKYEEAYLACREYIVGKDSVDKMAVQTQLDELRTTYEVDKLIAKEKVRKQQLIFAISGCVLLLIILFICILYSYHLRKKKISLVKQILEQDRLNKVLQEEKTEMERVRQLFVETTGKQIVSEERDELFESLENLMVNEKYYTNPNLNRKSLAEALGTNEKYLRETIKKHYELTVNEYITDLRLTHAKNLLLLPAEKYTIERIAIESGFGSRITFHVHFRERYGLTPDEFRKFATEQ